MNEKLQGFLPSLTGLKSLQFFVRFLGEILSSQIHSEINWPLGVTFTSLNKLKFCQLLRFDKNSIEKKIQSTNKREIKVPMPILKTRK